MTGNREWKEDGLGDSGETYLAGRDKLMRSVSRELLENPQQFEKDIVANGTSPEIAKREVETGDSILLQPVDTVAVNQALAGKSGVTTSPSYLGPEALNAYAPLKLPGLDWVIVAKIDKSEALAPVTSFARNIARCPPRESSCRQPARPVVQPDPHPSGQEPGRGRAPGGGR